MLKRLPSSFPLRFSLRYAALTAISLALISSPALPTGRADPPPALPGDRASKPSDRGVAPEESPFLFGCDWPVSGSPAVKSLFYETVCNFVRITGGGYGWAMDGHRKALQELEAHHVKALLQLGSHYPEARYFALKDSYFVDQNGDTGKEDRAAWAITYNGSAWPQYSYASDTFRAELAKDFTVYLNGVKDDANVSALLLHNEPGYHWLTDRVFDYNPQSIARFRVWLRRQHGTIANLNARWDAKFASFDEAQPPHDLPPVTNIGAWLDWRRFNADLIQDFLRSQIAFAHRARPGAPVTTNLSGPPDNWYPVRLGDNYRYTTDFDIAGIDIYPTEWTRPVFLGYTMDMTRGAAQEKKLYVAECEVFDPARFKGLSEEARAGLLRSEVWTFIGHGADAVLLWSLSGQDGFRLTQGEFNARVAATREIAHLAPMLHVNAFQKPERRTAVCVDQDAYLYYGGRGTKLGGAQQVDQAARGMYAALATGRRAADVVSVAQIREGLGKRYGTLVLSTPVLMDADLATRLKKFVGDGGLLITEAPFAACDRWGRALPRQPGFGLDTVFGIRNVRPAHSDGTITTTTGAFAGLRRTSFETTNGARVIGTFADGAPAVTLHRFGKEVAIYIAAEVGLPSEANWLTSGGAGAKGGLQTFLAGMLARYSQDPPPPANLTHQGATFVDLSTRSDRRGNRLVVLTNSMDQGKPLPPATNVQLSLAEASNASYAAFRFPPPSIGTGASSLVPNRSALFPASQATPFSLCRI